VPPLGCASQTEAQSAAPGFKNPWRVAPKPKAQSATHRVENPGLNDTKSAFAAPSRTAARIAVRIPDVVVAPGPAHHRPLHGAPKLKAQSAKADFVLL
jgi:hypothetical protein